MSVPCSHLVRWTVEGLCVAALLSLLWPLPPSLPAPARAPSLDITAQRGTLLREARPEGRQRSVSVADLPLFVVDALVAVEDQRFWFHPGVDPIAIGRALRQNWTHGRIVSGGSTLTMQVARLLRDDPPRTVGQKLIEMHLALRLELWHSKEEILSLWLNRVSFGNRARGIAAAARLYVGKAARNLTRPVICRGDSEYTVGPPGMRGGCG